MTTSNPLAKFDIAPEDIDRLVAAFYARIRAHPTLGPVFARAIAAEDGPEWRAHERKIAAFWRNAIGIERGAYDGNPMRVHVANPDVHPGMFSTWLALFRETAEEVLAPHQARAIAALADKIGESMRYGVTQRGQVKGAPPVLR
ncbi:MAG: group III truncated hemoglobin [Alphaproteobacteria bacterium]|nr:MAG: group III truncated hemoglobin [Alphaproteobacteria bacterium]